MVYDISNPANPSFVSYYLNRDFNVAANDAAAGDLAPEDLKFIAAKDSPNGSPLLVSANEVSGTLSIYSIGGTIGLEEYKRHQALQVFPNPVDDMVQFNRELEQAELFNMSGKRLMKINGRQADLSHLPAGIYTLKHEDSTLQILKK